MKTLVTIVGARPQFVKLAAVTQELRRHFRDVLCHTGQHYDDEMSKVFFDQLGIPAPAHNLAVGSGPHGQQTGEMLRRIEEVLVRERPAGVVVFGDTNTTLAGALAAAKLGIPVAHIEAGLRSFDRSMPEEINRVVTDHVAELLFAPTTTAVRNLANEGLTRGVHHTGDVMVDAMKAVEARLPAPPLPARSYVVATIHRAANTDDPARLAAIATALAELPLPVVFPVHPRTRARLGEVGGHVRAIEPVGYLEMLSLQKHARCVVTDSGGMQKEACLLGTPCVTLRETTEWPETVDCGWNQLVGAERLLAAVERARPGQRALDHEYGRGDAGARIVGLLHHAWS